MKRIALTENFYLDEFLDKHTYDNLLSMARLAQFIRTTAACPVTINDWLVGGNYNFSGFRPIGCTVGSPTSEHRIMKAIDVKISDWTGEQMQDWARFHANELYKLGVRRMEHVSLTPTWLHLDGREHGFKGIHVIDLHKVVEAIAI